MKQVTIITDGACLGNGKAINYGGWAAILKYIDRKGAEHKSAFHGDMKGTTNNRMELTAILKGVEKLKEPCNVIIMTDSTYAINAMSKIPDYIQQDWKFPCGIGTPKNDDIMKDFWQLISTRKHSVKFQHIKGHSGDPDNEKANSLAQASARALKALEAKNGYAVS